MSEDARILSEFAILERAIDSLARQVHERNLEIATLRRHNMTLMQALEARVGPAFGTPDWRELHVN